MRFLLAVLTMTWAAHASAEGIKSARYEEPTTRYAHGVLGDAIEHGALVMETDAGRTVRIRLPERRVFEDTLPRVLTLMATVMAKQLSLKATSRSEHAWPSTMKKVSLPRTSLLGSQIAGLRL